jgi:hypothetical protein
MDSWSRSWITPGCSFMTCGARPAQHGAHQRPRAHRDGGLWSPQPSAFDRHDIVSDDLAAAAAQIPACIEAKRGAPLALGTKCGRLRPEDRVATTRVATPADHAHFAAIAHAEAAEEEARFARAARTPPGERILTGMKLGANLPLTPPLLAEIDARADGQMELARRRIALGLGTKTRT